jgi:hypothetical protein
MAVTDVLLPFTLKQSVLFPCNDLNYRQIHLKIPPGNDPFLSTGILCAICLPLLLDHLASFVSPRLGCFCGLPSSSTSAGSHFPPWLDWVFPKNCPNSGLFSLCCTILSSSATGKKPAGGALPCPGCKPAGTRYGQRCS